MTFKCHHKKKIYFDKKIPKYYVSCANIETKLNQMADDCETEGYQY